MHDIKDLFEADEDGVVIAVHAQPGAGRSEIVGRFGEALKVKVAAPPEQGRANDSIAGLLAEELGVAASAVSVLSGAKSREKRFRVAGVDAETAAERLEPAVVAGGRKGPKRKARY